MVKEVKVKSILNKHKKRDDWFLDDYSVNPYYGCSFNCIYCYIKGSKYGSTELAAKINAPEILDRQLRHRAKKKEYGIIALSSSTEPYMHVERKFELTRMILQKILKYRFPVEIATKSKLVLRDLDVLEKIDSTAILPTDLAQRLGRGVIISFSISTLDEELAKIVEPGAPSPKERLETMLKCKQEGFLVGVNYIPVLPFLSDSEEDLDEMIKTAKDYGADYVLIGSLTLFGNEANDCKTLYYKFLEEYFPELVPKYKSLFKNSFAPPKRYQAKLAEISEGLCEKHGIRSRIA
ncbi:radical SAM protein [Archaeoglobales archaeon]|nr:MAG: radical SAM protein [Archaeoglobales archaeon]